MPTSLHEKNSLSKQILFPEDDYLSEHDSLHEHDFYAWTQQQADILKSGMLDNLDINNLIEELDSMGVSEKRELLHRLTVLIGHLLKWVYQPQRRGNSWLATIEAQRLEVIDLLQDNPSLKYQLNKQFEKAYLKAVLFAVKETDLPKSTFPDESPFSLEQVLDDTYLPE
ncbi:MAG: DUF29 domain-containing protein [Desulfamplus sp.]|nr:DUF29 domain-containing protein [Desulfamplus sp.]